MFLPAVRLIEHALPSVQKTLNFCSETQGAAAAVAWYCTVLQDLVAAILNQLALQHCTMDYQCQLHCGLPQLAYCSESAFSKAPMHVLEAEHLARTLNSCTTTREIQQSDY